jgi:O-antigen/teichoic acid export membrane protein
VIRKNLVYNSLLSLSQILFPLIIFPYTFKILEPSGTGLIGFVESLTNYLISLTAVGIPIYGVREVAKIKQNHTQLNKLFSELLGIHLFVTLLLLGIYIGLIFFVEKFASNKVLYFFSCGILFVNVFSVEWFFQGIEKFRFITLRTILIRILFIVAVLFFVRNKNDVYVYIFYGIAFSTTFINAAVNFTYAKKFVRPTFKFLKIRRHLKSLFYIFFATLAVNAYILLDTIILGFLTNDDEIVGYYSTALKICKIPLGIITALSAVIIPQISFSAATGNYRYTDSLLKKSFIFVFVLSVPIAIGLCLLAPDLILLLANENFLPAVPVIRLLSVLSLLIGLSNIFGLQMLTTMGKEKFTMYSVGVGMILSLTCNLILIPKFSYVGTAITTLFTEVIVTIMTGAFALKMFNTKLPLTVLGQSVIGSLLFFPLYFIIDRFTSITAFKISLMLFFGPIIYFSVLIFVFKNPLLRELYQKFFLVVKRKKIAS